MQDDLKPVSLVIPNYNGSRLLRDNLPCVIEALNAYPGSTELVVVDDGSSDDSLEVLQTRFPSVRVSVHPHNLGFSEACLTGVKAARFEHVVLLNSDVRPEPDFIWPLIRRLEDPKVFSVQSAIQVEAGVIHPYCLSRFRFRQGGLKRLKTPDLGAEGWLCLYASGGSMAFRRSVFLELGGFHPLYKPFYWEDFDLGLRAWRLGLETWTEPQSVVLHQEKGSIHDHIKRRTVKQALQRNKLMAEWVHFPARTLLLMMPIRVFIRVLLRTLIGDLGYLKAVFGALAHLQAVHHLRAAINASEVMSFDRVLALIAAQNAERLKALEARADGADDA